MSSMKYFQILRGKDQRTQEAVLDYIALGELDREIKTSQDREAWKSLWKEFVNSPKWIKALVFIHQYGV